MDDSGSVRGLWVVGCGLWVVGCGKGKGEMELEKGVKRTL